MIFTVVKTESIDRFQTADSLNKEVESAEYGDITLLFTAEICEQHWAYIRGSSIACTDPCHVRSDS